MKNQERKTRRTWWHSAVVHLKTTSGLLSADSECLFAACPPASECFFCQHVFHIVSGYRHQSLKIKPWAEERISFYHSNIQNRDLQHLLVQKYHKNNFAVGGERDRREDEARETGRMVSAVFS